MTTYQTLSEARAAAVTTAKAWAIIEIDHATDGHCYIVGLCGASNLRRALARNPMPEIKEVIGDHIIKAPTRYDDRDYSPFGDYETDHPSERSRRGRRPSIFHDFLDRD